MFAGGARNGDNNTRVSRATARREEGRMLGDFFRAWGKSLPDSASPTMTEVGRGGKGGGGV